MPDLTETLAERGARYGKFEDHAVIAQGLKDQMWATEGWSRLAPDQRQALEVIQDKVARILNGDPDYTDNWHDIAGYSRLVEDRLNARAAARATWNDEFVVPFTMPISPATAEQSSAQAPDSIIGDQWVVWTGGDCPVPGPALVQVWLSDGFVSKPRAASTFEWDHRNDGSDIVQYRRCWIEWTGGKCPVPPGTNVDVKHQDGGVYYHQPAGEFGCAYAWDHIGVAGDIIAYRLSPQRN